MESVVVVGTVDIVESVRCAPTHGYTDLEFSTSSARKRIRFSTMQLCRVELEQSMWSPAESDLGSPYPYLAHCSSVTAISRGSFCCGFPEVLLFLSTLSTVGRAYPHIRGCYPQPNRPPGVPGHPIYGASDAGGRLQAVGWATSSSRASISSRNLSRPAILSSSGCPSSPSCVCRPRSSHLHGARRARRPPSVHVWISGHRPARGVSPCNMCRMAFS